MVTNEIFIDIESCHAHSILIGKAQDTKKGSMQSEKIFEEIPLWREGLHPD